MIWWLLGCGAPCEPVPAADLVIEQIHARGPSIGESTLIVGPSGTSVLIDTGNDAHTSAVREALRHHVGEERVDVVLITHAHADHLGGLDDLLRTVDVGRVVHRGWTELGEGANRAEAAEVCAALGDVPVTALCTPEATGCAFDAPVAATACALPWTLDLGDGARLDVLAANGWTAAGPLLTLDTDDSEDENARSLAGTVTWGAFTYAFAGDLTGGGKDTPDVETPLAPTFSAADVVHLSHHGIRSSTNDAWVDALMPADGATRDALVGSNAGYLSSPAPEVLDRVRGRLGDGAVWAPATGSIAPRDDVLRDEGGAVVVGVTSTGWTVSRRDGTATCLRATRTTAR